MHPVLTAVLLLLLGYALLALWKLYRRTKQLEAFGVPDGNHWFLGQLAAFPGPNQDGMEWELNYVRKFKTCMSFRVGPVRHSLHIFHPTTAKEILKSAEPKDTATIYRFLLPWLGDGLLVSSGKKWSRNRRLLTPAFHFDILKPYTEVFNQSADKLCAQLQNRSEEEDGRGVELFSPVSCATLDVILRCAFSKKEEDLQSRGSKHPFVDAVYQSAEIIVKRSLTPWMYPETLFNTSPIGRTFNTFCRYLHGVSESVIQARKQQLVKDPEAVKKKKLLDFLDILLTARDSDGEGLTDLEIRNEVDTFMFEGHDTTASAISWVLKELAYNEEHADRCRREVRAVLRGRDTPDLTWDDLNQLPYTTMCIKEALRLHSPVPFISRTLTKDTELDGKIVPAGTPVDIIINLVHRNPYVWGEDAQEFKPERFQADNMAEMDSFAFIPFSAGPRNCIGQNFAMNEIKVTVAKVLLRFHLSPDEERVPRHISRLVMRSENGLWLKLRPL